MPVIEQLDHALTAIASLRRHNTDSDVDVILAAIERTMDNAFRHLLTAPTAGVR